MVQRTCSSARLLPLLLALVVASCSQGEAPPFAAANAGGGGADKVKEIEVHGGGSVIRDYKGWHREYRYIRCSVCRLAVERILELSKSEHFPLDSRATKGISGPAWKPRFPCLPGPALSE